MKRMEQRSLNCMMILLCTVLAVPGMVLLVKVAPWQRRDDVDEDVAAVAAEHRVRVDVDDDVEVAGRGTGTAGLAFSAQPKSLAGGDAGAVDGDAVGRRRAGAAVAGEQLALFRTGRGDPRTQRIGDVQPHLLHQPVIRAEGRNEGRKLLESANEFDPNPCASVRSGPRPCARSR